jgi:dipeptidyl aminopeptidase/acylaminoacyl peptidase
VRPNRWPLLLLPAPAGARPSDGWIVFGANRGDHQHHEVYLIRADGSEPRRLTETAHGASQPSWSPDGRWISYTSGPGRVRPLGHHPRWPLDGLLEPAFQGPVRRLQR